VQPYCYALSNILRAAIPRFAPEIAERFQPQKIILFGPYAYVEPHNESDVDRLVIMPAHGVVTQAIRLRGYSSGSFHIRLSSVHLSTLSVDCAPAIATGFCAM
jgi:predicted nucleotidyltransferase